jgi:hypothetical protein
MYLNTHKQASAADMNDSIMSDTSCIPPALMRNSFLNGAHQTSHIAEAHQPDFDEVDYENDSLYANRPFAGAYFAPTAIAIASAVAGNNISTPSSTR